MRNLTAYAVVRNSLIVVSITMKEQVVGQFVLVVTLKRLSFKEENFKSLNEKPFIKSINIIMSCI